MPRVLRAWIHIATTDPGRYLLLCFLLGLSLRWWLSGGDWLLFMDPFFPLRDWLF